MPPEVGYVYGNVGKSLFVISEFAAKLVVDIDGTQ